LAVRGSLAPGGTGKSKDGYTYLSGGYGNPGDPEYTLVTALLKTSVSIYTEGIKYPASIAGVGKSNPLYWDSVTSGEKALIGELDNVAKTCPNTLIWVGGYSQGAQVVANVFSVDDAKLYWAVNANLRGVVLTGDPTYWHGEAIDAAGNGLSDGKFSFARTRYSLDGYTALNKSNKAVNNFRSYCYGNDLWCQSCATCFSLSVHQSYGQPTTVKKEVAFLETFPS
jgi:hypothetical protein